jgi:aerobic-type carbon monoxide dehydrogenase small subunit (CoxS/CutS family)
LRHLTSSPRVPALGKSGADKQITAIERLEKDGKLTPLQGALQCVYCMSGMPIFY